MPSIDDDDEENVVSLEPLSSNAKPAKKPTRRPRWTRDGISPVFSLCKNAELKLSLSTRLARQTHARCIHST
jgi:hypothetical protein